MDIKDVTHQDSPKVPWPSRVYAVVEPEYPDEGIALFRDRLPRGLEESQTHAIQIYIPLSALLSDEVVEALAQSTWNVNGRLKGEPDWSTSYPHDRDTWMAEARRDLQAIIEKLGGAE